MSNANIILAGRRPKIDRAANRARAYKSVTDQQTAQLNALTMGANLQSMQRTAQSRNALRAIDPNAPDYHAQAATALQRIDPTAARGQIEKGQAAQLRALNLKTSEAELLRTQVGLIGSAFVGAETQTQVDNALASLRNNTNLDRAQIPETLTVDQAQRLMMSSMSVSDRLAQQDRTTKTQISRDTLTEKKRKNLADEQVTAADEHRKWIAASINVAKDKRDERTVTRRDEELGIKQRTEDRLTKEARVKAYKTKSRYKLVVKQTKEKEKILRNAITRARALIADMGLDSLGVGPKTGIHSWWLEMVPFSKTQALAHELKTLSANVGFGGLQEIKESSPTGGGVGSLSEREFENLAALKGSLAITNPDLENTFLQIEASLETMLPFMEESLKNYEKIDAEGVKSILDSHDPNAQPLQSRIDHQRGLIDPDAAPAVFQGPTQDPQSFNQWFRQLPPGTPFVAPDGTTRVRR